MRNRISERGKNPGGRSRVLDHRRRGGLALPIPLRFVAVAADRTTYGSLSGNTLVLSSTRGALYFSR
jgi:hypothetical protein